MQKLIKVGSISDARLKFLWTDCCKATNEMQRSGQCTGGATTIDPLVERARAANNEAARNTKVWLMDAGESG